MPAGHDLHLCDLIPFAFPWSSYISDYLTEAPVTRVYARDTYKQVTYAFA